MEILFKKNKTLKIKLQYLDIYLFIFNITCTNIGHIVVNVLMIIHNSDSSNLGLVKCIELTLVNNKYQAHKVCKYLGLTFIINILLINCIKSFL